MTVEDLTEFLAWVEDEFTNTDEDTYEAIDKNGLWDGTFTREQVAERYLTEIRDQG